MFAGVIEFVDSDSQASVGDCLERQAASKHGLAEIPFDDSGLWRHLSATSKEINLNVTLVQQRQWNTAESKKEKGIVKDLDTGAQILSWSRIDNRDELLAKLDTDSWDERRQDLVTSDAGLILLCWKQWRESVNEHLIGDFAFAIYEPANESSSEILFLGRDHLGVKPLYFYQDGHRFVFSTSLAVIANCSSLNLEYSDEWLARYVLGCASDWNITPYQNIKKVPPAHCLLYKGKKIVQRRYFQFSEQSDLNLESDQAYVNEYRRLFYQAVKARSKSDYPIASEMSGGLDSSSITAVAAGQVSDSQCDLISYAVIRSEEEPGCIDAVNRSVNMSPTILIDSNDLRKTDFKSIENDFIRTIGTPVEHGIAITHHYFYKDAQQKDARTLLSGFGGDEFTTNYGSLALLELWKHGHYLKWAERFRGGWLTSKLRAVKWLFRYFYSNVKSLSSRHLIQQASERWRMNPVSEEISRKYDLKTKSMTPALYDSGHQTINSFILNNRWSPMMTARLENCTLMAAKYGIEYRWPLLDIRLLNFFLSVPSEQKLGRGGAGRYLHRRAMMEMLPDEIIWRDKSMGPPIAQALSTHAPEVQPLCKNAISTGALEIPALKRILNTGSCQQMVDAKDKKQSADLIRAELISRIEHLARWLIREQA